MSKTWQLQEAKARFSELFTAVCDNGPQKVSRRGKETIVLLKEDQYQTLTGGNPDFVSFLLSSPKADLKMERPQDPGRTIVL